MARHLRWPHESAGNDSAASASPPHRAGMANDFATPTRRRAARVPMPTLKDFLCGGDRRVPQAPLPSMNPLDTWTRAAQSGLRATWLGHSTVLLEIDGWRVLTDPVWGPRASPTRFVGTQTIPARAGGDE